MAIETRTLPIAAVQLHPESVLTLGGEVGRRLIQEVVARLHPAAESLRRRAASCDKPERNLYGATVANLTYLRWRYLLTAQGP